MTSNISVIWNLLTFHTASPLNPSVFFIPAAPLLTVSWSVPWPLWWRPSRPGRVDQLWCSSCSPPATAGSPSSAWTDTVNIRTTSIHLTASYKVILESLTVSPLIFCVVCRWGWRRSIWLSLLICNLLCVLLSLLVGCFCVGHLQQSGLSLEGKEIL